MKFIDVTEPGWYWIRADQYRDWTPAFITNSRKNPEHPLHKKMAVDFSRTGPFYGGGQENKDEYEVVGPIAVPTNGA